MSRKATFLVAVMAVMSLGLSAMAAPSVDTLLTAGYDSEEMALVFNSSDVSDEAEDLEKCKIDGEFTYAAGEAEEGSLTTPVEVVGLDEIPDDCEVELGFQALDVVGPNGQVNHGTVVSSFVHAIKTVQDDINGIGCLVSALNSLDLEVDQVKVNDDEETTSETPSVVEEETDDYTVLLKTAEAKCQNPDKPSDKGKPENPGKSADAGKPENPGKSADAGKPDKATGPEWKEAGEGKPGNGKDK